MTNEDLIDLGKCKEILSGIFLGSEDILSLVMPVLDDPDFSISQNWLGGSCSLMDAESGHVIKTADLPGHCFDIPYLPAAISGEKAIITMESRITKCENEQTKEITLDIYAIAHKNIIQLTETEKINYQAKGYYGNRIDILTAAIHNSIKERSRDFGIGRLNLASKEPVIPCFPDDNYYGRQISYSCSSYYIKRRNGDSR